MVGIVNIFILGSATLKKLALALIVLAVTSSYPFHVYGQEKDFADVPSFDLGIGFTLSPETFLIGGKFDFPLGFGFSIGPLAQVGFNDDTTLFGISGDLKYTFSVPNEPRFLPSLEVGAGALFTDHHDSDTDTGFLLVLGGGLDYMVTNHVGLGVHVYASPVIGDENNDFLFSALFGTRINL